MGRSRSTAKHLPLRMQAKGGGYYYVYRKDSKNVWESLGRDYGAALLKWAEREGRELKGERSVSHALANYLETEKHRLKPATMAGYKRSAARLIKVFGKMELGDVTPNNVYEYLRRAGNVQANRDKALLSAVYGAARSWGWYAGDNPAKGVRRNPEHERKRYVTDAELSALMLASPPKLACIIKFAYLTGMSQEDILLVEMADVVDDGFEFVRRKTGKEMFMEWSDELTVTIEEAKRLWRRFGRRYLFETTKTKKRKEGPYSGDGLRTLWRRAKIKAGLPDIRFHDLRRKAGSDAPDDAQARAMLGHQDERTTRKHYRAKRERVRPVK